MLRSARLFLVPALAFTLVSFVRPARAAVPTPITAGAVAKQMETQLRSCMDFDGLQVVVTPFDDDAQTQQGHFQSINISCTVARSGEFAFRDFSVKSTDVTLALDKLFADKPSTVKLAGGGKTEISGRVLCTDMNTMLQKGSSSWVRSSGLTNMAIAFADGAITFSGESKDLCGAKVEVTGGITIREASMIDFSPTDAKVNGFAVPVALLKGLLKKLNPLYNFGELPLQPTIDKVTITTEYILVQG
jgi:hypothetical protein